MGGTVTFGTLQTGAGRARGWLLAVGSLLLILGIVGLSRAKLESGLAACASDASETCRREPH